MSAFEIKIESFALKFIFSIDDQSREVILFVRKSFDQEAKRILRIVDGSKLANSS